MFFFWSLIPHQISNLIAVSPFYAFFVVVWGEVGTGCSPHKKLARERWLWVCPPWILDPGQGGAVTPWIWICQSKKNVFYALVTQQIFTKVTSHVRT